MKRQLIILALSLGSATCLITAQDGKRPAPPEGGGSGSRIHVLPRGAEETLNLTADQKKQVADLEAEVKTKIEKILTPEQIEKLKTMRPPQPPGGQDNRGQRPPAPGGKSAAAQPPVATLNVASTKPLPAGVTRVPVTFSGGHDTVPVDHGRPVKLIAAALGVQEEVFREAFSHVHPAGPGSGGPTDAEARQNKAALMNALGKFGVTNDRLNTVSNFYRYAAWQGGIWKNKPATVSALVKNGVITGFEIISGGYGYTTPPSVSVPGIAGAAKVELAFGKDMESNGAISAITIPRTQ
jgi:Spy/CpxP family protein refolding chaperone